MTKAVFWTKAQSLVLFNFDIGHQGKLEKINLQVIFLI